MNPEQWRQVKSLFHEAAELAPGARRSFLQTQCNGDAELMRELQLLLESHEEAEDFIEQPALASASEILQTDGNGFWVGRKIGQYRVLRELGRGGMGVVYLAERVDDQFSQRVAIKLVRRGLDTEDILRRFRNERQILASLNHPNIAKLFDGGTTEDGLPYLVMEYIEGLPLLEYCDEQNLSTNERLGLFRTVCSAVQYAHQSLVIHRDLKPSNILVTRDSEVKLLDFGVAKLLNPELAGMSMTQTRPRAMTPEYASPEQARGSHITTASDIYSLGVILYELLTGTRPYKLKDTSPEELSRVICDVEPTKPSDAIAECGFRIAESKSAVPESQSRACPPQSKNPHSAIRNPQSLRGDIDNIVLMALRKEPERRYKSVEQFSEDIRRHLEGRPVIARKDTFPYRSAKFVKRNKAAVAAASLVFLTLLGGIIATSWQARKAREQARLANAKNAEAQAASREAQAALQKAEKINRFMQSIFAYANPAWFGRAGGRSNVSVLEAMRDIEKHIDEDFRDEPDVRADVYQQIGDSYRTQSLVEDAERNLRKALQLRLELYGEDSTKVAESMYILSGVRHRQGDLAEHERLLTKALNIQRRHPDESNNLPYIIDDYASLLYEVKNDYAGAVTLAREALDMFRRRYDENHYMVGATQEMLVRFYATLGDYAQAEAVAEEHFRQHPSSDPGVMRGYAYVKIYKGDYQAAENGIRQMLIKGQSRDAQPYLWRVHLYSLQSFMAYRRGDYAQALAYSEKALAAMPVNHDALYGRAVNLSPILNKLGEARRAESLLREAIEELRLTDRALDLAILKSTLGESLTMQRRFAEAEPLLLEAYETQKSRVLPSEYKLVQTRQRLAALYRAWGKPDEAKKYE